MSRTTGLPLVTTTVDVGSGSQSAVVGQSSEPTTSFGFGGGDPDFTGGPIGPGTMAQQHGDSSSIPLGTRVGMSIGLVVLLLLVAVAFLWVRTRKKRARLDISQNDKKLIINNMEDNDVTTRHTNGPGARSSNQGFTDESPSRRSRISLAVSSPSTPTGYMPPMVPAANLASSRSSQGLFRTESLQTSAPLDGAAAALPMPGAVDGPEWSDPYPVPVVARRPLRQRQLSLTSRVSDAESTCPDFYPSSPVRPGDLPLGAPSLRSTTSESSTAANNKPQFLHMEQSTTPGIQAETATAIAKLHNVDKEHYDLVQVAHSDGPLTFDLHFSNATITFPPPASDRALLQPYHVHVGRLLDTGMLRAAVPGLDILSVPIAVSPVSDHAAAADDVVFHLDQVLMCDVRSLRERSSGVAVVLLSLRSSRDPGVWSVTELSDGDLRSEPSVNGDRHWHRMPEAGFGCYVVAALPRAELAKHPDGIPVRQGVLEAMRGNAPVGVGARGGSGGGGQGRGGAGASTCRSGGNGGEATGGGNRTLEPAIATGVHDVLGSAKKIRLLLFIRKPPLLEFCHPPPPWVVRAYPIWKDDEAAKRAIASTEKANLFYIHTDEPSLGSLRPHEEVEFSVKIQSWLRSTYKFDTDIPQPFDHQDIRDRRSLSLTLEMLCNLNAASPDLEFEAIVNKNIEPSGMRPVYKGLVKTLVKISCSSAQRVREDTEYDNAPVQEMVRPAVDHSQQSLSNSSDGTLIWEGSARSRDTSPSSRSISATSAGMLRPSRRSYLVDEAASQRSDAAPSPARVPERQPVGQQYRFLMSQQATRSQGAALPDVEPMEEVGPGPEEESGPVRRHSHRWSQGFDRSPVHEEETGHPVTMAGAESLPCATSEPRLASRERSQSRRSSAHSTSSDTFPYRQHGNSHTSSLVLSSSSSDNSTRYRLVPLPVASQADGGQAGGGGGGHVALHQPSFAQSHPRRTSLSSAGGLSSRSLSVRSLPYSSLEESQLQVGMTGQGPGSVAPSSSSPIHTILEDDSSRASPVLRPGCATSASPALMPGHTTTESSD